MRQKLTSDRFWETLTHDQQIWFAATRHVSARIGKPLWQQSHALGLAIRAEIEGNASGMPEARPAGWENTQKLQEVANLGEAVLDAIEGGYSSLAYCLAIHAAHMAAVIVPELSRQED